MVPSYEAYLASGRRLIGAEDYGECMADTDCVIRLLCGKSPDISDEDVRSAYFIAAESLYRENSRRGISSERAGDYSVTYSEDSRVPRIPPEAYLILVRAGYICRAVSEFGE